VSDDPRLERAASAAYLIALGATHADAAEAVGVTRRTIVRYRADTDLWTKAERVARERWLGGITAQVRERLAERLADPDVSDRLLEWAAERLLPELAAPAVAVDAHVQHQVTGHVEHEHKPASERLEEKIRAIRERRAEIEADDALPALPAGDDNNTNGAEVHK